MRLHFIENGPALLVEQEQRVLVVADLHMGIESGLERCGVHITSRSDARAKRVISCIEETRPDLLLLLGDLKHNVPVTTRSRRELPRILQSFRELVPIAVTRATMTAGSTGSSRRANSCPREARSSTASGISTATPILPPLFSAAS